MTLRRDKSEKFISLANKRVNRAIKDIQLIRNLSNRQNYDYTPEQAKKIVKTLDEEIDRLKISFSEQKSHTDKEFKL